jgi:hypothetical protein
MVHALEEIKRSLGPNGTLIDLRPLADRWPVEVTTVEAVHETGRLTDLPAGLSDDEAANSAMEETARLGWFIRQEEHIFQMYIYWDDPQEMSTYMSERWADFVKLETETLQATQLAWEETNEEKHVRIQMKMLLTRWRK